MEGIGGHTELIASPVLTFRAPRHSSFPPLTSLSGQSASQETKCPAGPSRHVAADLTKQRQRDFLPAWNLRHIHSEEFVGFGTQIEFWMGRPFFFVRARFRFRSAGNGRSAGPTRGSKSGSIFSISRSQFTICC